jgi:hypothetical protein
MMDVSHSTQGEIVLHLGGTFDAAAARRVCGRLSELPAHADVVIDFNQVKQLHDHGLAAIAGAIGARAPGVAVRGLGRHHERLLRYLGVDLACATRRAWEPSPGDRS